MIATAKLIHAAAYALLTTGVGGEALTAAGLADPLGSGTRSGDVTTRATQGQALPYVEFGQVTESERERTTSTRSTTLTLTCAVHATSLGTAHDVAAVLVDTLARRVSITPAGGEPDGTAPYVTDADLELYGPPIEDPGDPATWTLPVRIRYRVHQPATQAE